MSSEEVDQGEKSGEKSGPSIHPLSNEKPQRLLYGSQGNFKRYYSYRDKYDSEEHRLRGISKHLVENKLCLDIGCNEGRFTLEVAKQLEPRLILGIDLDKRLTDSAQASVKRSIYKINQLESDEKETANIVPTQSISTSESKVNSTAVKKVTIFKPRSLTIASSKQFAQSNTQKLSSSNTEPDTSRDHATSIKPIEGGSTSPFIAPISLAKKKFISQSHPNPLINQEILSNPILKSPNFSPCQFPYNVNFLADNFMWSKLGNTQFEVIFCMSVTKWIHGTLGDQGILSFFRLVHRTLYPGGIFICEYQHWKSYLNSRKNSPEIKAMVPNLTIKPEDFENILLNQIGFSLIARLGTPLSEAHDFSRPILVLRKESAIDGLAIRRPTQSTDIKKIYMSSSAEEHSSNEESSASDKRRRIEIGDSDT